MKIAVIIPALNEAETIVQAIRRVPLAPDRITVVDNGSSDGTSWMARAYGARVVATSPPGYGRACLAGMAINDDAEVLVFMDADLSERPEDLSVLLEPILSGDADLVMGSRGGRGRPWHADAGTRLCVWLINRWWGTAYEDLGPFRAVRASSLWMLDMQDRTWGWTIEMQVKAAEAGLRCLELPIASGQRAAGTSKISGSIIGTARAAVRMLQTIIWLRLTRSGRVSRYLNGLSRSP
ncbi:MAG: glycosyltransferase family 2 protein [Vicinamibacterales bacterium]